MLIDLLRDNLTFIIIGVSVILVIILGYVLLVRPKSFVKEDKAKKTEDKIETASEKEETIEEEVVVSEPEKKEVVHYSSSHQKKSHIKTADELMQHIDSERDEVTYIPEEKPKKETKVKTPVHLNNESDDDLAKYHVIFREKDGMWYVKRENSHRTLRVLHTKKEAIAYATIKAINQDSNIVIHGEDGKIEKHGY